MKKMTRNESKDYVRNDANWEVIPGNDYVRCSRMEIGTRSFIRIEHLVCINILEAVYMKTAEPKVGFKGFGLYYIDEKTGGLTSVNESDMADYIYQWAKAEAE